MKLLACVAAAVMLMPLPGTAQQKSPGAGPVIVLETARGVIEIETYPDEAPKSVALIVGLVKKGFYNGLRFHRAEPNFVIQVGDPQTRDMTKQDSWGRGNSGTPVGVAEITKKRKHGPGAVGLGHSGSAKDASSQFYITLRATPSLDGKYTVFGQVIQGPRRRREDSEGRRAQEGFNKGVTGGRTFTSPFRSG
jgi:peptidyl-prolyl cis-trans isomerase B (cyclophilin B)